MSTSSYLNSRLGVGDKAWQEGKAPITRFLTDDGVVRGFPFHHVQKTYEDPVLKALLITYPDGVIEIRGPQVGDFHAQLAQGNIDLVKATGEGIVTVMFYPAVTDDDPDDSLLNADEEPAAAALGEEKG